MFGLSYLNQPVLLIAPDLCFFLTVCSLTRLNFWGCTASVVDEWTSIERLWNATDRGKLKYCPSAIYFHLLMRVWKSGATPPFPLCTLKVFIVAPFLCLVFERYDCVETNDNDVTILRTNKNSEGWQLWRTAVVLCRSGARLKGLVLCHAMASGWRNLWNNNWDVST